VITPIASICQSSGSRQFLGDMGVLENPGSGVMLESAVRVPVLYISQVFVNEGSISSVGS